MGNFWQLSQCGEINLNSEYLVFTNINEVIIQSQKYFVHCCCPFSPFFSAHVAAKVQNIFIFILYRQESFLKRLFFFSVLYVQFLFYCSYQTSAFYFFFTSNSLSLRQPIPLAFSLVLCVFAFMSVWFNIECSCQIQLLRSKLGFIVLSMRVSLCVF